MKITFIGTGTMASTTRCNTSVLVDDILFDIGMGTVKQIERLKIYTKTINYMVISHFHADHFLDIPNFLFGRIIRKEAEKKLTIIGPIGIKRKTIELMNFTHSDGDEHRYDNLEEKYNIEFIELDNKDFYCTNEFKITAFGSMSSFWTLFLRIFFTFLLVSHYPNIPFDFLVHMVLYSR